MIATHHRELGLTDAEYELIFEKLGREPNEVERAVFSLMWSERCGYKHSRRLLKTLPTEGGRLVLGPGENAGAVDLGDGLASDHDLELGGAQRGPLHGLRPDLVSAEGELGELRAQLRDRQAEVEERAQDHVPRRPRRAIEVRHPTHRIPHS